MAQRVRDILLRIRGDASSAERELHDLATDLKRFDGVTAEATVDINTQAAERKIKSAEDAVKDFGRISEEAKIDLQTTAANTRLKQLRQDLQNLQEKPVTPKIEMNIGRTIAQIERVEAKLDALDRRRASLPVYGPSPRPDVDVDVDRDRRGIGRLAVTGATAALAGAGAAAQGLGLFISAASTGIPIIGDLGRLLIQLGISGAALAPVFLILVPLIGVALVGAVTLLAGAVVALGASFLTAAAGVGVLAIALAAAFGPVLLVAIAAMARFAKILEAVKQAEDGAAEGAERVRDANRAQADAQRNAADAAARIRTTAVDAYRAWAQAAEETSDAIRGIAQAELSRDQARLNVEQAEENLRSLREEAGLTGDSLDGMFKKFTDVDFRPTDLIGAIQKSEVGKQACGSELDIAQAILDVRQARLSEQEAIDGVSDAHTRLQDARTREQEFIQQGINAYEPYTAAVKAHEEAQRSLKRATEDVTEARAKQNEALKDLTPQERRLVDVLTRLKETLTDVFRPATRAIFDGLLDALEDLSDFAKDTCVRRGLTDIGRAVGGLFRGLGRELRRRETREAFAEFARGGADIIRALTPVFRHLSRLILNVAREALPWLLEIIRDIGRAFRRWAGDIDKSDVEGFVERVKKSFNAWKRIAKDLWDIIKEFFGDANDSGDELAGHIHDILVDFKEWLQQNPDGIKRFFDTAVDLAKKLLDILEAIMWTMDKISQLWKHLDISEHLPGGGPGIPTGTPLTPSRSHIDVTKALLTDPRTTPDQRREARQRLRMWGVPGYAGGGLIRRFLGSGWGDSEPVLAEPGEYMIKKSIAQAIGTPRLNLLNAGKLNALTSAGVHIENINLPPAPGHSQLGDPRHQAVQLARELRRRGEIGIAGGGIP